MKKGFALSVAALVVAAFAVQGESLYSGQLIAETGVTLSSWGGGKISEVKDVSLAGGNALKVETTNFFQGGLIQWAKPVDLTAALQNKDSMLAVGVWIVNPTGAGGGGGAAGGGGDVGPSGGGGGGERGGGRYGGVGVGAGGGAPGGGGGGTQAPAKKMTRLRMVIKTSDGKLSEAILPVNSSGRWVRTSIPVKLIPGFSKSNHMISAIAVSGDAPAYFYIGEIRVTTDTTPIQGSIVNTELNIGRGTDVTLSGNAEAGITPVEFVWDFDSKDGLQDEAFGQSILHRFRIPGDFMVTLTVRDIYGVKKPWTGTFHVTVNP